MARHYSRWSVFALCFLSMLALSACGKRVPGAAIPTVTLVVTNRGYFDVNIYVLRSPVTNGTRVGTVTGGSSMTFRVKETDLQQGSYMVLGVRPIAGRTSWTSQQLAVNIGSVAILEVYSTSTGDLSQSRFYLQ